MKTDNQSYVFTGQMGQNIKMYRMLAGHNPQEKIAQGIYRFIKHMNTLSINHPQLLKHNYICLNTGLQGDYL